MKQITFTRESFYNLVWSKSISELSKEFRVSTSDLIKMCKHYSIPTPITGYWQKIKHNKPAPVIKLPENLLESEIILIKRGRGEEDIPFYICPLKIRAYELQNDQSINLEVPLRLKKLHPLILKTKNKLEELDKITKPNYEIRTSIFKEILPIHTDLKLRNRALRIMNTLVTFIYQNNHSIVFGYNRCHVEMFGQKTEINLRQKINRVRTKDDNGWGRQDWVKSNNLEFQAGPSFRQKSWIDKKKKKLEDYIPNIIAWIEQDCKYWHDLRKRQAEEEKIRAIEVAEAVEKERLKVLEKEKYDNLIIDSQNWHKAKILKDYVNAVKQSSKRNNNLNKQKEEWLKWAFGIADSIDLLNK
ncbi:hypothetical protein MWU50_10340 [Flavobacteriaceae bacterium S0862]|nr:hypothetical protein [Flavobacteriaceae bacterium S0862]